MKALFNVAVLAVVLAAAPNPCFALWDPETLTKERAKELGMEVRSEPPGANDVRVHLEFTTEGKLKDFSQVDLQISEGNKPSLTATLKEDRSKPGRVVVSFSADRAQLDKASLSVRVPYRDGGAGGAIYTLRVRDFVEPKKER